VSAARYDERSAIHEAGHAVVAWALGRDVVTIHVCECGNGFVHTKPQTADDDGLVVRMAGVIAEMTKYGPDAVREMSDNDRFGFEGMSEAERERIASRAADLVAATWDTVETLAAALVERGTLHFDVKAESRRRPRPANRRRRTAPVSARSRPRTSVRRGGR